MVKRINSLKACARFCLLLLQITNIWCQDLSSSVVEIYSAENYLCAGTLVKNDFVVTSAECLAQPRNSTVLTVVGNAAGAEITPADKSVVLDIFIPASFNIKTKHMDVAVLKLKKSIGGTKIRPAELCEKSVIEAGEALTIYFWDLRIRVPRINCPLRTLQLNVIDSAICAQSYGEQYSDTIFCAAEPGRNYFFYDRGGLAAIDGQFCGIYHHGDEELQRNVPGSLTSLANPQVIQFIKESLEKY